MKFRTGIELPSYPFRLAHGKAILALGSCFTEHIGGWLRENWFDIQVNPFGTLFHPVAVENLLWRTVEREFFGPGDLFLHQGWWKSFELPSRFNRRRAEDYLSHINALLENLRTYLSRTHTAMLTYGTAQVFVHRETGILTANCHKVDGKAFERQMLPTDRLARSIRHSIRLLRRMQPGMNILLSVSPVRYLQDGLPANVRSKARLLEAVWQATEKEERVFYFPAYEIFMDDLRDYRFYAPDLVHPGEQGIRYVRELFAGAFLEPQTRDLNRRIARWRSAYLHRPLTEKSPSLHEKVKSEIEKLLSEYPFLKPDIEI